MKIKLLNNQYLWAVIVVCMLTQVSQVYAMQLGPPLTARFGEVSLIPRDQRLVVDVLKSNADDRKMLIWSMYPASTRGRVFGARGGDPVATGGW